MVRKETGTNGPELEETDEVGPLTYRFLFSVIIQAARYMLPESDKVTAENAQLPSANYLSLPHSKECHGIKKYSNRDNQTYWEYVFNPVFMLGTHISRIIQDADCLMLEA